MSKVKVLHLVMVCAFLTWTISACSFLPVWYTPTPWPTPSMSELISDFSSPDVHERAGAANWAGSYSDHPSKALLVPYLVEALSDPDNEVRTFAASSIRRLGIYDERAIETLISWLDEEGHSGEELVQAITVLEVFASYASDATPGLIHVMMTPPYRSPYYRQVREAATRALVAIRDPLAVPYLLSILLSTDEQSWVRKSAAIALAEYGPTAVCSVPYLVPLLDSPEPDVRISAAIVISQATGNAFPDSEKDNWAIELVEGGGHSIGPWRFEQDTDGEYLIVTAAKEWWQEIGQYEDWPQCNAGLDGEPVLPVPGQASTAFDQKL